jgi:hypothetical protein
MKPHTLPVKRRPAPKGMFKRLMAVTGNRKQRVAAAATAEMEADEGGSKISRALTIIFLIHIVAIGLIFVHQTFLDGREPEVAASVEVKKQDSVPAVASAPRRTDLPRLASGEKPYVVMQGDNYARIAAQAEVDEADWKSFPVCCSRSRRSASSRLSHRKWMRSAARLRPIVIVVW